MREDARVRLQRAGRVATLELTGRRGVNAMDFQFVEELARLVDEVHALSDDQQIDVLVLQAAGRNFCVGGDLEHFASVEDTPSHIARMAVVAHRAIHNLYRLEIPVIARWNGAAAGGGIGLLLAADIIIAAQTATMTAGYSAAGLTPDAGVSWSLPRMIGSAKALELLLTNRRVKADELLALGIVSHVSDEDHLDEAVEALIASILHVSGDTSRATKRLTRSSLDNSLSAHLDSEAESIASLAAMPQFVSALQQFRGSANGD